MLRACMCARIRASTHACAYACLCALQRQGRSSSLEARSMRQQTEAQRLLRIHHMQLSVGKQPSAVSGPVESQQVTAVPRAEVQFKKKC